MAGPATGQRSLRFKTWGGIRKGAGRKARDRRSPHEHDRRAPFRALPVHATLRLARDVPRLRQTTIFREVARVFQAVRDRYGMRLNHYSVQGNHIHLIVEAENKGALTRGMRGLTIRLALTINRVAGRRGQVFPRRYHAHVLRTPTETRNALRYVLGNKESHWRRAGRSPSRRWRADIYSSAALAFADLRAWVLEWLVLDPIRDAEITAPPRTWLLRHAGSIGRASAV